MREASSACLALPAPQKPSRDCCGLQGTVFQHRSCFAHKGPVLCYGQQRLGGSRLKVKGCTMQNVTREGIAPSVFGSLKAFKMLLTEVRASCAC